MAKLRTVLAAALAAVALAGCAQPTTLPQRDALRVALSRPESLRGAIATAARLVQNLRNPPASEAFHLVALRGEHLDARGRTVPAQGSHWHLTFSRYSGPPPATQYEVVEVLVPGAGYADLRSLVSGDPAYSPLENGNALMAERAPDSEALLAPLKARGIALEGATIELARGIVTMRAGGRSVNYDPTAGTFSAVK